MATNNPILDIENLIDALPSLKPEDNIVYSIDDFQITLSRRVTSTENAKRKAYAYRGIIYFTYGPARVKTSCEFIGNDDRSYFNLVTNNLRLIVQRARQHFQLTDSEILASEKLANFN